MMAESLCVCHISATNGQQMKKYRVLFVEGCICVGIHLAKIQLFVQKILLLTSPFQYSIKNRNSTVKKHDLNQICKFYFSEKNIKKNVTCYPSLVTRGYGYGYTVHQLIKGNLCPLQTIMLFNTDKICVAKMQITMT